MAAKKALTMSIRISGARETAAKFRELPKEASAELRDAAGLIANDMVDWIKSAAAADSRQSAAVAVTTKVRRDRFPVVEIGGDQVVTSSGAQAFEILFGANFGSRSYPRFRPWAGVGNDYFVFSQIEGHQAEIDERWNAAADKIIDSWAQGGDAAGGDD